MDPEKLNRNPWGRGRKKNEVRVGESQSMRLLKTENKLRVDGGWEGGGVGDGYCEDTFWDEHWVLYGNQFDNEFHILKKKKEIILAT